MLAARGGCLREEHGSGSVEIDVHAAAQCRRDVDQRVEREAGHPAAEQIVDPGLRHALPKSFFHDFKILSWRRLCFLVEGVQDVDSVLAPGQVNHAVGAA